MKRGKAAPRTRNSDPSEADDPTTAWARDAQGVYVGGDVELGRGAGCTGGQDRVGELVGAACGGGSRDLKDGPPRELHWRPDKAAHALAFYPTEVTATAGSLAGQPFNLLCWQLFTAG